MRTGPVQTPAFQRRNQISPPASASVVLALIK